ncbi:hypothetical protein G7Y89_g604 [Cudoniella acicularis]|uniref:Uncharacterized protein n=1 Tax=Cudoniella acicularis TaxID=354080 RepID=A0A8H4RYI3_9HELO|nr:hypothetical protein G7Y89_g604 [Cudoniella acicularis]
MHIPALSHLLPAALLATPTLGGLVSISIQDDNGHQSSSSSLIQAPFLDSGVPAPPNLEHLYTATLHCGPSLSTGGEGPHGERSVIPIVGGNFTGPKISGQISNLGADWGLISSKGTFYADSRSNLVTPEGVNIYLQQSGTGGQIGGRTFLRMVYETGHPKYYWLNNVVAIGTLTFEGETSDGGSLFKIEAFVMT